LTTTLVIDIPIQVAGKERIIRITVTYPDEGNPSISRVTI